jgi:DNA-binding MarR family transcriptional regulator
MADVTSVEAQEWLDDREQQAWRALQFMQMRLNARLARDLAAESGLSYPDYVVLVALTERPDGRMRAFEPGDQLGWEQSRVSHHLGRMARRGLVTREANDSDRRGADICVTPHGRETIAAAAPGHVAAVRRAFLDHVTPAELDAIASAATKVLAALD